MQKKGRLEVHGACVMVKTWSKHVLCVHQTGKTSVNPMSNPKCWSGIPIRIPPLGDFSTNANDANDGKKPMVGFFNDMLHLKSFINIIIPWE